MEFRWWERLFRWVVGDGERASAISLAVCTRDARVAAGCPYSEENSDEVECELLLMCWGGFCVGVISPVTEAGLEAEITEGGLL